MEAIHYYLTDDPLIEETLANPSKHFSSDTQFLVKIIDFGESKDILSTWSTEVWGNATYRHPE